MTFFDPIITKFCESVPPSHHLDKYSFVQFSIPASVRKIYLVTLTISPSVEAITFGEGPGFISLFTGRLSPNLPYCCPVPSDTAGKFQPYRIIKGEVIQVLKELAGILDLLGYGAKCNLLFATVCHSRICEPTFIRFYRIVVSDILITTPITLSVIPIANTSFT